MCDQFIVFIGYKAQYWHEVVGALSLEKVAGFSLFSARIMSATVGFKKGQACVCYFNTPVPDFFGGVFYVCYKLS